MQLTIDQIKEISEMVFSKYAIVGKAWVIGSYARGRAKDTSDVDFMVELPARYDAKVKYALVDELESALGKSVDLVTTQAVYFIPGDFAKMVDKEKQLVFTKGA